MPNKKEKSKGKILTTNRKTTKNKFLNRGMYLVYVIILGLFIGYHSYYSDRIIPGVRANGLDLGGYTTSELIQYINSELNNDSTIKVNVGEDYSTELSKSEIDFRILAVKTTTEAFEVGRNEGFFRDTLTKLSALFSPVDIGFEYEFNENKLENEVSRIKSESGVLMKETSFNYENGVLEIIPGESGFSFENNLLRDEIISRFYNNKEEDIRIDLVEMKPLYSVEDLAVIQDGVLSIINTSYYFSFRNRNWNLTPSEVLGFIEVTKTNSDMGFSINSIAVANKLSSIAEEVDRNSRGQVLEVENGRAVRFVASEDGLRVKIKESVEAAELNILEKVSQIPLAVQVVAAPEADNEFGIEEVIGSGVSKFAGSSAGRVHNIELAASRVSGVLVAPGDVFSFNESVGAINRQTGYTSAWVISKGRTVLGDGGGVCQVSTTVFRAALNAGLPIVERSAHSYRVGYYEQESPVGLDATIYIPTVDFKFRNDTAGYILVTSEVDTPNSTLYFNIYGKDDGRVVEVSEPVILSRTSPPAPVYEEDPTLPKGQQVRVESPVAGASVVFNRKVTRGDETLYEDTFRSNYRAWGAVYKVGTKEN